MRAKDLYHYLEQDFPVERCKDHWEEVGNKEFITEQYLERYMGLLSDHSEEIDFVYTAVPLDANGEYSTTMNFAKALGVEVLEEFYEYFGVFVGVIGTTNCKDLEELKHRSKNLILHR